MTALAIVLLAGTAAAFSLTEALKLERSLISVRRFDQGLSPGCRCPAGTARFIVRLRDADTIDATIVDAAGDEMRVLASGVQRPAGLVRLKWDGRDDAGRMVPEGNYRLRIRLHDKERTIVIPRTIRVDAAPSAGALGKTAERES